MLARAGGEGLRVIGRRAGRVADERLLLLVLRARALSVRGRRFEIDVRRRSSGRRRRGGRITAPNEVVFQIGDNPIGELVTPYIKASELQLMRARGQEGAEV